MKNRFLAILTGALLCGSTLAHAAATIVIVNDDPAGVGFNDPTPKSAVGGNNGATLGEQRLIAFQAAADKWGATLTSVPIIRVRATWEPLSCNANSAVLGSAGAQEVFASFPGAPRANTWYSGALANAIVGQTMTGVPEIRARFNVNLGNTGCLTGVPFYLGIDNNHGNLIDLVAVLLHEFGHGLGFQTFTNGSTGAFLFGLPSAWDHYLTDATTSKTWVQMTDAERAASSLKTGRLVWGGNVVNDAATNILNPGVPVLTVSAPASVAKKYEVGTASFGPALFTPGIVDKQIMPVVDQADGKTGLACNPLSATNRAAVVGKIALVDRGTCTFNVKAANVQAAGAVAMVVVDNVEAFPPPGLGGTDATITIPSVRITLSAGNALKTALLTRTRTSSSVVASLGIDLTLRQGKDVNGRILMYAPNPFQGGSSVSHFDVTATPNLLMEPAINGDLLHEVKPPKDLTYKLLQEIGWQ